MNLLSATLDELLIDATVHDRALKKKLLDSLPMSTVFELVIFSERELLNFAGIGPASIQYLKFCLIANGFRLRNDDETVITWINTLADKAGGYPLTLLNFEQVVMHKPTYNRSLIVDSLFEQGATELSFLDGLTIFDIKSLMTYPVIEPGSILEMTQVDFDEFSVRAAAWSHPLLNFAA